MKRTKKGWMAYSPDGVGKVLMHESPSDHHAWANALSRLRKLGYRD